MCILLHKRRHTSSDTYIYTDVDMYVDIDVDTQGATYISSSIYMYRRIYTDEDMDVARRYVCR